METINIKSLTYKDRDDPDKVVLYPLFKKPGVGLIKSISTSPKEKNQMNKKNNFPPGWDEFRVKRVLEYYEAQSEDEAAYEDPNQTFMEVPNELVPAVRELIAKKLELSKNA